MSMEWTGTPTEAVSQRRPFRDIGARQIDNARLDELSAEIENDYRVIELCCFWCFKAVIAGCIVGIVWAAVNGGLV